MIYELHITACNVLFRLLAKQLCRRCCRMVTANDNSLNTFVPDSQHLCLLSDAAFHAKQKKILNLVNKAG